MKITSQDIKLLEEYASIEGTELGEYWYKMYEMISYDYLMSNEFKQVFYYELFNVVKDLKENYIIVETTQTRTTTIRELCHKDEI